MDDLYQQEILEHFKNPHHYGAIHPADQIIEETNASCGDSFTFFIKFSADKVIENLHFTGTGCAISTAASSMLIDYLIGKPVSELNQLDLNFMQHLIGAPVTASRQKCLMLPAKALSKITL